MDSSSLGHFSKRLDAITGSVESLYAVDSDKQIVFNSKTNQFEGRAVTKLDYSPNAGSSETLKKAASRVSSSLLEGLKHLKQSVTQEVGSFRAIVEDKSTVNAEIKEISAKMANIGMRVFHLQSDVGEKERILDQFKAHPNGGKIKEVEALLESFNSLSIVITDLVAPAKGKGGDVEDASAQKFMKKVRIDELSNASMTALDKLSSKEVNSWVLFKEDKTGTNVCMIKKSNQQVETFRMLKRDADHNPVPMTLEEVVKLKNLDTNKRVE